MLALTLFTLCASAALTMQAGIRNHSNKTFSATDHMSERIVNGVTAKNRQEFPYMVYFEVSFSHFVSMCSGALISDKWVLTAAHCVDEPQIFSVVAYLDILDNNNLKNRYEVSRSVMHPNYDKRTSRNDIALLRLSQSVAFSYVTNTIRLGADNVPPGVNVIAVGYGRTSINDEASSGKLRYASLQTISNKECAQSYRNNVLYEGFLCTSGKMYKATCIGDSGGPLVYRQGGMAVVVGVISYGDGTCDASNAKVYTRISRYIPWIQQTMNENNYRTNNFL